MESILLVFIWAVLFNKFVKSSFCSFSPNFNGSSFSLNLIISLVILFLSLIYLSNYSFKCYIGWSLWFPDFSADLDFFSIFPKFSN